MAFEEQITETIEAGAPSIKYEGDIQQQQQIAQQLWENLPPEARAQFGSFEQFFSSGAWKKVLQALQQQHATTSPSARSSTNGPRSSTNGATTSRRYRFHDASMARGGVPEEVISLMEGRPRDISRGEE